VLYLVSPKAYLPGVPFVTVPWVLAPYFLFTVLRLAVSYRRTAPRGS